MKTTYKLDEAREALYQIGLLRYYKGWAGCLKLETNGKHIIITQYPSSNSWQQGYETIFVLNEYNTISDMEGFYLREDGKVEVQLDTPDGVEGEYYEKADIMTRKQAAQIICDEIVEENIQEVQEIIGIIKKQGSLFL